MSEKVLLIQNKHDSFAVSLLSALKLLSCYCSEATGRCCCDSRRWVLHTAEQGARRGPSRLIVDCTVGKFCWVCLSSMKEALENFKKVQVEGISKESTSRTLSGITANVVQLMTWKFMGEDPALECFPSCCWLQHNGNTDTSKIKVSI